MQDGKRAGLNFFTIDRLRSERIINCSTDLVVRFRIGILVIFDLV